MCVSPSYIYADKGPSFERLEVACGWCWSCRKNRLNDIVGRCLCEASTSDWVYFLNLTYRPAQPPMTTAAQQNQYQKLPSEMQTQIIHKEDCQHFLKHLRRSFKLRYLVAGEYGTKSTKRAHFHAILFGTGNPPSWELNKNTHINEWPWGHVYCENNGSEQSIRYVAKYLLKGAKRKRTDEVKNKFNAEWISYSRIPIMGLDYVYDLAARYAAEKVYPHSFKYRPPMAQQNREYQFSGEARHVLLDALYELWPEAMNSKKTPTMERAHRRWIKDRQKKRWEKLKPSQRKKYLDINLTRQSIVDPKKKRLYGRYLAERLRNAAQTIEDFSQSDPGAFALVRDAFKRDIIAAPPTYAETGIKFPAGTCRSYGKA